MCVCARIIDQGLMCLIRSIDSNMADLGLHITPLPISRQALPSSAATCQNQLLVLQIGLCLFLYVFPVFELLSVLFCSVLLCLGSGYGLLDCEAARLGGPAGAQGAPRAESGQRGVMRGLCKLFTNISRHQNDPRRLRVLIELTPHHLLWQRG